MPRPLITIGDETREMNDAEFEQYQKDQAEAEIYKAAQIEAANKRQALLDKLGIDEDEARLLLG